jgi:hypothetical protein
MAVRCPLHKNWCFRLLGPLVLTLRARDGPPVFAERVKLWKLYMFGRGGRAQNWPPLVGLVNARYSQCAQLDGLWPDLIGPSFSIVLYNTPPFFLRDP